MKICYVDEAGCTGMLPAANSNIQPACVFAAVFIDYARLHSATESYLRLKQKFFPGVFPAQVNRFLTGILPEIKGADLRSQIVSGNRNQRRHALGFLDGICRIIDDHQARLTGRVWIKAIAAPVDGRALYTFSIQAVYSVFQKYLEAHNDFGTVVLDSRWQHLNKEVAHSIFTQKFRLAGDPFDRIVDLPAFAHSNNHAGLQIADLVASGMLFPMATFAYCTGHVTGVHVQPHYSRIKLRYGLRLKAAQYQYLEASGRTKGGITVSDPLAQRHSGLLFN